MSLTWSNKWIQSYESYWCTINKLKYANAISGTELLSIINFSTRYTDHSTSCYSTLIQKLESIGVLSSEHHIHALSNLLGKLYENDTLDKYMNPFLTYCPSCLGVGYHSWLHQSIFIDKCPIHNITLQSTCPCCNQPISLDINSTKSIPAFTCLCGYNFLQNQQYRSIICNWIEPINFSNSAIQISKLLTSSLNTYYYLYNSKCNCQPLQNLNLEFLSLASNNVLDLVHFKSTHFSFDTSPINDKPKITSYLSEQQQLFLLVELYLNALKCIAKMLRRKHRSINTTIELFKHYRTNQFYCSVNKDLEISSDTIVAYAYLMWRKDVEGHETFETVHTDLKAGSYSIVFTGLHQHIFKSNLFQYFWCQLKELNTPSLSQKKLQTFYLTMNCLMHDMLLSHYKNWYNYAHQKFYQLKHITVTDLYENISYHLPFYLLHHNSHYKLILSKVTILYQEEEDIVPYDINYIN